MDSTGLVQPAEALRTVLESTVLPEGSALPFPEQVARLFGTGFARLYRYLDRLSGEPELAADLAQEAFVRLYQRGSVPEQPEAWLISVAMNLFRNARSTARRRRRLLTPERGEWSVSDPPVSPERAVVAEESRRRVRAALDRLPERERHLLLLSAEGYSYGDIARSLELHQASVGTLLARARRAFRALYGEASHAP